MIEESQVTSTQKDSSFQDDDMDVIKKHQTPENCSSEHQSASI